MLNNQLRIPVQDLAIIKLIKPNFVTGPWIAGGSVIQWYNGNPVNDHDVDVFFQNQAQYTQVRDRIQLYLNDKDTLGLSCSLIFTSPNAETFKIHSHTVQLIKARFYSSVTELLDRFDIIACKIATDGHTWFSNHSQTEKHIQKSILDMDKIVSDSAVKRLFKYWIYGFQPTESLIQRIQSCQELNTNFSNSSDYDS